MRLLLSAALLSSCLGAWLVGAQRFVLDGVSEPCVKSFSEIGVVSVTVCSMYCHFKGCVLSSFQDGLCRIYHAGYVDSTPRMRSSYRFFTGLANVAGGKAVTSAKQYATDLAEKANDCSLGTFYHSDYGQLYAWWNVDLGYPTNIHVIRIYPQYKNQAHINRFHHIEVSVGSVAAAGGDASTYTVVANFIGPFDNSSCCSVEYTFDPPVSARFVHIRRSTAPNIDEDYLIMREVEVLSPDVY